MIQLETFLEDILRLLKNIISAVYNWLPHIPPKEISDERKGLRKSLTLSYGYYAFTITLIFILVIPYWNKISDTLFFGIYSRLVSQIKFARIRNNYFTLNLEVIKIIVFWSSVLGLLSLLQIHNDVQFLAARLGRVATYCLPSLLFLTLRPSPLPQTLYLSLIPIHKWLSRIVVLQSFLHTSFYLIFFIDRGTLSKVWRADNLNGCAAMLAFTIIFLTSLPTIRRKIYNLFYICHYVCTWIAVVTLYFHARPPIPYLTTTNICILIYQVCYRFMITKSTNIEAIQISSNLTLVTLPNNSIANKSGLPGCHLRLIDFDDHNYIKQLYKNLFAPIQHPFTIATLPIDETQKLIVRKGNFKLDSNQKYLITGSYLPFLHFLKPMKNSNPKSLLFHTTVKKCLIVVGGSAISFALPILRTLSYNGATVKIIWVIKDHEDLKVLDYFKNILANNDCIDIFITGRYSETEKGSFKDAVAELHRRRRELEILEQDRMLSGNYYANNEIEKDFNQHLPASITPATRKNQPFELPRERQSPPDESSPLFTPAVNYGSSSTPVDAEFDPELGFGTLAATHRNSYISLKNHQNKSAAGYSYADENTFENVDLDLDRGCKSSKSTNSLSEAATATSSNIDLLSPQISFDFSGTQTPYKFTSIEAQSPGVGFDSGVSNDNATNEFGKRSVSSSSDLYDDLSDYWVLKGLSCRIEFGRPKLGLYYYNWCIGSSCIGPLVDLQSGKSVCCNEITKKSRENPNSSNSNKLKFKKSNGRIFGEDMQDELFLNDQFIKNRQDRFNKRGGKLDENTWVVGAGPIELVNKVRLWSSDCGFHFHAESFSV